MLGSVFRWILALLAAGATASLGYLFATEWLGIPDTTRNFWLNVFGIGLAPFLLVLGWRPLPGPRLSLRERLLLFFEPVNLDRVGTRPPPSGAGLAFAVSGLILGGLIFLGVLVMGIVMRDWTLVLSGGLMGVVCCALGVPAAHTLRRRRARRPGAP